MHQIYRILRNNKEAGPYSLEELMGLSLQPTDLVWVEGKSAGWKFPTEIDSLQSFFDPTPSPVQSPPPVVAAVAETSALAHPASHPTRYNQFTDNSPAPGQDSFSEGEELTAEKLEKKAEEIYRRIQAYEQNKEQASENVQTKYARSLDDLKEEYADWLHQHKKKRKFVLPVIPPKILAAAIAVVFLTILTGMVMLRAKDKEDIKAAVPVQLPSSNLVAASTEVSDAGSRIDKNFDLSEQISKNALPSYRSSVDIFIDSVEKALAASEKRSAGPLPKIRNTKTYYNSSLHDSNAAEAVASSPAAQHEAMTYPVQKVNMNAHYEQDANRKNISSLEVTIQNNSPSLVRSVTVDVFYYKKGARLFDKETLYFNNIAPGNSITLSRPGNKRALSATFQLGQVDIIEN